MTRPSAMQAPFEAFYMPADSAEKVGRRFCLFHPAQGDKVRGAVVYIHPFSEEMNKSRRMAAIQSRALARSGFAVLQIDLLGCGDSSGDFGDATWQAWVDDVRQACTWISERVSAPLWLWGLRSGCLLAVDAAKQLPSCPNFLFWAPTVSGKQVLQQFLRLKAASELASGNAKKVLDGLRSALAQERSVEIAGYQLAPALANGLAQSGLHPPAVTGTSPRAEWFELSTRDDAVLSPVNAAALAQWTESGWSAARGHVVCGPAFWQTAEIEDAPALIDATLTTLCENDIA